MKFFIDTANLEQIQEAYDLGVLDGVTTNPSLMAKEGIKGTQNQREHYIKICEIVNGDVSAEVIATDYEGMIREGEELAALNPHIVTVAQNINGRPGNAILGEETRIVYGAECMRDQLLGCEFDISPTAFYQTNPQQTELLYQLAIDGMDLQQGDVLMDAYCGSGTIGLCAAKAAQDKGVGIMLLGVERNHAGIADARRNAELNGLTRSAWFMADDATDYILDAADNNERVDVLSIDPPRAGSTPEFLEAACALKPRRITYISCNPVTQERDLHQLLDGGYRLLKITPVDMFPHTDHTETVAVLERR